MTHKQIIYGDHAVGRLQRRRVSRSEVRWVLANGVLKSEKSKYGDAVWSRTGYLGKMQMKVVFSEGRRVVFVITVEFVPKTPRSRRKHPREKF